MDVSLNNYTIRHGGALPALQRRRQEDWEFKVTAVRIARWKQIDLCILNWL